MKPQQVQKRVSRAVIDAGGTATVSHLQWATGAPRRQVRKALIVLNLEAARTEQTPAAGVRGAAARLGRHLRPVR